MKCIIPLARGGGFDKGTNNTPYLISVASKPLLGHLLDQILPLRPEEVIFILGEQDRQLMDYVTSSYDFKTRFVLQKQSKGSAHAIYGAKEFVKGDVVVLFGDTFFDADLKGLKESKDDAIIWTRKVEDSSELGVVFLNGDCVSKLIEKPDEPVSNLAMIGLYYFKNAKDLFESINYLLEHKIKTKGGYHLTDAMQHFIDSGKRVGVREASDWIDADHGDGIFELNQKLIGTSSRLNGKTFNSIIIRPSHIGKGAIIRNSVIGPHASIGVGSVIEGSIVKESIVCTGVEVTGASLERSVIATGARVKGRGRTLTLEPNTKFNF